MFLWVGERAVNPLCIHQWFCMLEEWSEEDKAMLSIQRVQLTWKLNLSPTCWSGTPFCRGLVLSTNDFVVNLEVSSSWGESGNPLRIHQWFCMLEGWSEEDRAMLLIQSVQLTWKLNLLPTCRSGTPFCRGLCLSTNDIVVVWTFFRVGERARIYSVLTNDFVC